MITLAYPGLVAKSTNTVSTMAPLRHISAVRAYKYSRKVWIVDVWVIGLPTPVRQGGLTEQQAYQLQTNILIAIKEEQQVRGY